MYNNQKSLLLFLLLDPWLPVPLVIVKFNSSQIIVKIYKGIVKDPHADQHWTERRFFCLLHIYISAHKWLTCFFRNIELFIWIGQFLYLTIAVRSRARPWNWHRSWSLEQGFEFFFQILIPYLCSSSSVRVYSTENATNPEILGLQPHPPKSPSSLIL